jgi:NADH:ubiquinone reductase (H+-translocating)
MGPSDKASQGAEARPRVVIVGAGFGGMEAAMRLAHADSDIDLTVIDRQNYHLFQPLLYQVATSILQPGDIAVPVRRMVHRHGDAMVLMSRVTAIDATGGIVRTHDRNVPYDYLILATGSTTSYFGNDELADRTFGLKTLDDAERLRHQILLAFERAEMTDDEDERRRMMTFVVVGGGPNGVSTAAAMAELTHQVLASDFRRIDATASRIILAEAGKTILPGFPEKLVEYAAKTLKTKGVQIRLEAAVEDVENGTAVIGDQRLDAGTVVWTAGVEATQIGHWLDVPCDDNGRVMVASDLSAPGYANIHVIGDAAHLKGEYGKPLPGLAAVAKQQGRYVADLVLAHIEGRRSPGPFVYRDYGTLVPIGGGAAIAQTLKSDLTGIRAWFVWAVAHIAFLMDGRRRLSVSFNWFWAYLTARRGARIIVDRLGTDIEVAGRKGTDEAPRLRAAGERG